MEPVKDIHNYLAKKQRPFKPIPLNNQWKGGAIDEEHNWNCPANWSLHRIPQKYDIVVIPGGSELANYAPSIRSDVGLIYYLVINQGAEMHLSSTGSICISGNEQEDAAIFLDGGRLVNEGTIQIHYLGNKGIAMIDAYFVNKGILKVPQTEEIVLANHKSIYLNKGEILFKEP